MRKVSMALLVGVLVAAPGCNITIPSNLINIQSDDDGTKPIGIKNDPCVADYYRLDTDGDKRVSRKEYMAGTPVPAIYPPPDLNPRFDGLDADGDGYLSEKEYSATCGTEDKGGGTVVGRPPVMPPVADEDCRLTFKNFDANGDGTWDGAEFKQWAATQPVPAIACAEPIPVDDSVNITPEARLQSMPMPPCDMPGPRFENHDHDRDGRISADEFCGQIAVPPTPPQPPAGDCEETFRRADTNGDRLVDFEEYARADYRPPAPDGMARPAVMPPLEEMKAVFTKKDMNQDGKLDAKEFCLDWAPVMPPPPPADDCALQFKRMDASGEGKLTWEEFFTHHSATVDFGNEADYARYKEELNRKFKGLDLDSNGVVTVEEHCGTNQPLPSGCESSFKTFDKDGSGALSYDEYASGRYGEIRFVQAPSQEEVARMIDEFKAKARELDTNGDQKLAFEEFKASCQ